jgi:hypothetical protein
VPSYTCRRDWLGLPVLVLVQGYDEGSLGSWRTQSDLLEV